jgi:hypothetical protein
MKIYSIVKLQSLKLVAMPFQPEYHGAMRRIPAILLVFVFSFSLIAPAVFSDAESNLPACCRRDGKHHCSMTSREMADVAVAPSSGSAVDALRARCPLFPSGGAVVPNPEAALLAACLPAGISTVSQMATLARAEAGYRISFNRSHQKRGPPSLLS